MNPSKDLCLARTASGVDLPFGGQQSRGEIRSFHAAECRHEAKDPLNSAPTADALQVLGWITTEPLSTREVEQAGHPIDMEKKGPQPRRHPVLLRLRNVDLRETAVRGRQEGRPASRRIKTPYAVKANIGHDHPTSDALKCCVTAGAKIPGPAHPLLEHATGLYKDRLNCHGLHRRVGLGRALPRVWWML